MDKIKIGIQGGKGSSNERAAQNFILRQGWHDADIEFVYLMNSDPVVSAVINEEIDYGVFAFRSKTLLVKETLEALEKYGYLSVEIVDEVGLFLDHALFKVGTIDKSKPVKVCSHLQALKIHESFLKEYYGESVELIPEIDTAESVKKLSEGGYPENSVAIGPLGCQALYPVDVVYSDVPTNHDYITKFWLIKKHKD